MFFSSFCTLSCRLKSCCCISCMYCGCSWLVIDSFIFAMVCFASWSWISIVLLRSSAVFVLAACFFAVCGVDACIVLSSIFLRFSFFLVGLVGGICLFIRKEVFPGVVTVFPSYLLLSSCSWAVLSMNLGVCLLFASSWIHLLPFPSSSHAHGPSSKGVNLPNGPLVT